MAYFERFSALVNASIVCASESKVYLYRRSPERS
jgi:hypothetical protein